LKIKLTTQDIAAIAVCSALYAVFGYLTAGITFFGVGFLPAVLIPAVFATLYGPWVGGISGAIGIFIRDIFVHGNAPLSLIAGVPANFILFFLIGYLYTKNISLKQALTFVSLAIIGLLAPSIVFFSDMIAYTGLSNGEFIIIFLLTVVGSLVAIAVVSVRWKEWRSYAIGTVIGQITGGLLLSITVWVVSPLFLDYFRAPFGTVFILPLFVWTVATEIPFILITGPPIIKAVQRAFPALQYRNKPQGKDGTLDQKSC
jgi:hypothetical protein